MRRSPPRAASPARAATVADRGELAPNALAAQFGGTLADRQGLRSSPSSAISPRTALRVRRRRHAHRRLLLGRPRRHAGRPGPSPLLGPDEMGNARRPIVGEDRARALRRPIQALFGADILDHPDDAFGRITLAHPAVPARGHRASRPFSSKYDAFLRGQAPLAAGAARPRALQRSEQGQLRGLPSVGEGRRRQPSAVHGLQLRQPRRAAQPGLQRNADPEYFDLGLCGAPGRALAARTDLCGAFKVPTLAQRRARRLVLPQRPLQDAEGGADLLRAARHRTRTGGIRSTRTATGQVRRPAAAYRANVNTSEAPVRPPPGRRAGAERRRDRRRDRVPADADRQRVDGALNPNPPEPR